MECLQGWLAKYIAKGSRLWIYRRESFYVQAEKPVLPSAMEYIMDGARVFRQIVSLCEQIKCSNCMKFSCLKIISWQMLALSCII